MLRCSKSNHFEFISLLFSTSEHLRNKIVENGVIATFKNCAFVNFSAPILNNITRGGCVYVENGIGAVFKKPDFVNLNAPYSQQHNGWLRLRWERGNRFIQKLRFCKLQRPYSQQHNTGWLSSCWEHKNAPFHPHFHCSHQPNKCPAGFCAALIECR